MIHFWRSHCGGVDACARNCSQDNLMQTTHLGYREEPELIRGILASMSRSEKPKRSRPIALALHIPATSFKSCSCVVFGQIAHRHMEIPRMWTKHYQVRIFPWPQYYLGIILLTALILGRLSFLELSLHWYIYAFLKSYESLLFIYYHHNQFSLWPIRFTHLPSQQLHTRASSDNTLHLPFHWIKMPCLPFTSTPSSPSNTPKSHPSIMLHTPPGNIHVAKKPLLILILK